MTYLRPSHTAQHGFTLMEIMVVIAVLSIAFVGIFGVFHTAITTSKQTENISAVGEMCRLVSEQLSDDMESIYPLPLTHPNESRIRQYPFVCKDNAPSRLGSVVMMDFHTTSSLRFDSTYPVRNVNRVQWVLTPTSRQDQKGNTLYLFERRELPVTAYDYSTLVEEDIPWSSIELADSIVALHLLFFDAQGLDATSWNSADSGKLPKRVKVELEVGGQTPRRIEFTRWWSKEDE